MWLYDSLARYPHSSVMGQVQNTWSPLSVSGENMKGSSLSTAVYWNMGYLKPRINEYCCFWVILSQVVMELCGHRLRFASWSNISPIPNITELGKSGLVSAGTSSKLERFTGNDRDWIVMCHNIFSERTPMASQWVTKCTSCRGMAAMYWAAGTTRHLERGRSRGYDERDQTQRLGLHKLTLPAPSCWLRLHGELRGSEMALFDAAVSILNPKLIKRMPNGNHSGYQRALNRTLDSNGIEDMLSESGKKKNRGVITEE